MIVSREVFVAVDPTRVFAYLSDFTTTTEWDPGTIRTTKVDGNGGVGTVYRNTSQFNGRSTELTYIVTKFDPPKVITLRGENATLVATDTITVKPEGNGSRVTYRARFAFKGAWKMVAPFLRSGFKKLGDEAQAGLLEALNKLN